MTNYAQFVFEKSAGQPARPVFGSDFSLETQLSDVEKTLMQSVDNINRKYPDGLETCFNVDEMTSGTQGYSRYSLGFYVTQ